MRIVGNVLLLVACAGVSACASWGVKDDAGQDPLKNTRKFVNEEHPALYREGAIQVPMTTIHLIPPGPSALELAGEMVGVRTVQSAQESLAHARESLHLAQAGVARSVGIARAVNEGTNRAAAVPHAAIPLGLKVAGKALDVRAGVVDAANTGAEQTDATLTEAGKQTASGALEARRRIIAGSDTLAAQTDANLTEAGNRTADGALAARTRIVDASATRAEHTSAAIAAAGQDIADRAQETGSALSRAADERSGDIWTGSKVRAARVSEASGAAAGRNLSYAWERFTQGNAAVGGKISQHVDAVAESLSLQRFIEAVRGSNHTRNRQSAALLGTMAETTDHYREDVSKAFDMADQAGSGDGKAKSGPVLAALKSVGWKAKAVIWDAAIKPVGKVVGAGVGLVAANGVVFPVMVVGHAGASAVNVAVQVTWNTGAGVYDVTAPTATAAVAGLFGLAEAAGGKVAAGAMLAGGGTAALGTYGTGKAAAGTTRAGGWLAGTALYAAAPVSSLGIQAGGQVAGGAVAGGGWLAGKAIYVAAPLSSLGIQAGGQVAGNVAGVGGWAAGRGVQVSAPLAAVAIKGGGQVAGAAAGVATAAGGAGIAATGGVAELATQATGKAATAVIGAGGSVASVAGGGALGAYEVAKMYVVPAAHVLGSGLVLGYGALSQLGAQAVYGAGDALYMVMSLEGERWVLYAVKGNIDKGDQLPPGTLLDLGAMQKAGETFYAVPVSDEETQRLLKAVPDDLPVIAKPADTAAR